MSKSTAKKSKLKEQIIPIKEYALTLADLKKQIKEAQVKAVLSANKEMLKLYWAIGKVIAEKQKNSGWAVTSLKNLQKIFKMNFQKLAAFQKICSE